MERLEANGDHRGFIILSLASSLSTWVYYYSSYYWTAHQTQIKVTLISLCMPVKNAMPISSHPVSASLKQ